MANGILSLTVLEIEMNQKAIDRIVDAVVRKYPGCTSKKIRGIVGRVFSCRGMHLGAKIRISRQRNQLISESLKEYW